MKRVVSISLGSARGDFSQQLNIAGEKLWVQRIGTEGSISRACELLRQLDGRVEVLCLGGVNQAYYAGGRAYPLPAWKRLASQVNSSPLVDGHWVKEYLEPEFVGRLATQGVDFRDKRALLVSALDRPYLAAALERQGCSLLIGDAAFGLGLPLAFQNMDTFTQIARLTLPLLRFVPLRYLYPLGERQNHIRPRFRRLYRKADIVAGDFHFIYRHLPPDLTGKIILTGTVRPDDVQQLRSRGARLLITFFSSVDGRALAANVWEGIIQARLGRSPRDAEPEATWSLLESAGLGPKVVRLN